MNILFLAPQPFFEVRGTPINVRRMVMALGEAGHLVELVVYPHGEDVDIPNVIVNRVAKVPGLGKAPIGPSKAKIVYDAVMFVQVAWLLLVRRFDVIHAVEEAGFIAWFLSKIFRVPYIFDMDSHISDQLAYSKFFKNSLLLKFASWLEKSALKRSSAVVTVCPYLTDVAKTYTGGAKIHQIEDIPMDLPPSPEGWTTEKLRAETGVPEGAPVVLYTGNLEKYQGIDLLMETIPEVVKSEPSVKFIVVGGDVKTVADYALKAMDAGFGDNVYFTGPKPMEWMNLYHEMADILLSPRIEGTNTPLKIYTYLDTGKPIVATSLPTHTQLLNPEVAMLAKPEKMEYSSAILLLLKDAEMRRKIGAAGKAFVEKHYNYETFKRKLENVYNSI